MGGITADELFNVVGSGKQESLPAVPVTPETAGQPITAENISQAMVAAPEKSSLTWPEALAQGVTNIPQSGAQFYGNLYEAITNPVETFKGATRVVGGGILHAFSDEFVNWAKKYAHDPKYFQRALDESGAFGKMLIDRYGSSENLRQTIAHDPVGVAADLSVLFSGGASAASKVGVIPKVAKGLETIATATNPIAAPLKAVEFGGKNILGMTTGVGAENIANAAKAGFEGDKSFLGQLRREAPMNEPLDNARHNLNVMRQKRGAAYRSGMVDISKDKNVLDFADIDNTLSKAEKEVSFPRQS